jgi:hypothetical protein
MLSTRLRTELEPEPDAPEHDVPVHDDAAVDVSRAPSTYLDTRAWLAEAVDGRLGAVVGIAWFVLVQVAYVLEPPTNRPEPFIGVLLEVTMYLLLATMITGLVMQRRFGLVAAVGASVLATAATIACPVSGHHTFGTWWYGEMACVLALVGISVAALHRSTTARVESPSS